MCGLKYSESKWVDADELLSFSEGNTLVKRFNRKGNTRTEAPFYDPYFDVIDRIISKKGKSYRVKWMNLQYNETTFETSVPDDAICEWKNRKKQVFPRKSEDVKSGRRDCISDLGSFRGMCPTHFLMLNVLIYDFVHGVTSTIVDKYGMEVNEPLCAFLKCLAMYGENGPFLVVAPKAMACEYYNALRTMPHKTALAFFGSDESREIAREEDFFGYKDNLNFHVLVTSGEALSKETEIIGSVNWRVVIVDDTMKSNPTQTRYGKNVQKLEVGHNVLLRQPLANLAEMRAFTDLLLSADAKDILAEDVVNEAEQVRARLQTKLAKRKGGSEIGFSTLFVDCPLSDMQKGAVRRVIEEAHEGVEKGDFVAVCREIHKVCVHPLLINGDDCALYNKDYLNCSTKLRVIDVLLKDAKEWGEIVLVVSQFSLFLDLVEDVATSCELPCERMNAPFVDVNTSGASVFTYNPLFCEFNNAMFTGIDIVIVVDGDPRDFVNDVIDAYTKDSKSLRLSKVYCLYCRGCSESILNSVCAINPRRPPDRQLCEKVCRLAVLTSLSEVPVPTPDALVRRGTSARYKHDPNDAICAELADCDFWKYVLRPVTEQPEKSIIQTVCEWTPRNRDQLLRALTKFGLNRWDKIRHEIELAIEDGELVSVSRSLIREIIRLCSTPNGHQTVKMLVHEMETDDDDITLDRKFVDETCFGDKVFRANLQRYGSLVLRKIESLHYIGKCYKENIDDIDIESALGQGLEEWWDSECDQLLIHATWQFGLGCYERFCDSQDERITQIFGSEGDQMEYRRLTDRIFRIAEALKRTKVVAEPKEKSKGPKKPRQRKKSKEDSSQVHSQDEDSEEDGRHTRKFTRSEEGMALQRVLKFGVDEDENGDFDYKEFTSRSGLWESRNVDEVKEYVENMIHRAGIPMEEGGLRHTTSIRVNLRLNGMRQVRTIVRAGNTAKAVIASIHWRGMPDSWTPAHELLFYTEISKRGFGEYEDILAMPDFSDALPDDKPGFLFKNSPVIKRIGRVVEALNKPKKETKNKEKPAKPRKTTGSFPTVADVANGEVNYPIRINKSCSVLCLGHVDSKRLSYHTERYIYPVGYRIERPFQSMTEKNGEESWTAEIQKQKAKPKFVIWPTKAPDFIFEGDTPSSPWMKARRAIGSKIRVNGQDLFLLSNDDVIFCIQNLPGADRCSKYVMKESTRTQSGRKKTAR